MIPRWMDPYEHYLMQERTKIVKMYFATKSPTLVPRQFQHKFPGKKIPHRHTITRLIEKFRNTGNAVNNNKGHCSQSSRQGLRHMFKMSEPGCNNHPASPSEGCHSKWVYPADMCAESSTTIWNYFPTKCRYSKCKLKPTRQNVMNLARK